MELLFCTSALSLSVSSVASANQTKPPSSTAVAAATVAMSCPRHSAVNLDDLRVFEMGHGLDTEGLSPFMDSVLRCVYFVLPDPPVSTTAALSAADAPADDGEGAERISRLPDDLLRAVVSRIPVKDGARTAVLSSRWRRLWRSTPLVLVDTHLLPGGEAGPRPPRAVTDAVSRVLEAHPGPFPFVSLSCSFIDDDAQRDVAARWLDLLAAKGVDDLNFVNRHWPLGRVRLPAELFGCSSLRSLYIGAWALPDTSALPRAAAFPNLQELVLGCVVMDDRDLELLLAASPVLETLSVFGSLNRQPVVRLSSRSLRCVQLYLSFIEEVAVVDAPQLEQLSLEENMALTRVQIGHAPQLLMLDCLLPGVNVLQIGNTIIKVVVPSVALLGLNMCFGICNEVKMLPSFLKCFPNIETLIVKSEKAPEFISNDVNTKFWQEAGPIACVQSHLKMVVLRGFQGEQSELSFLRFIAENARVLEKIVIKLEVGRRYEMDGLSFKIFDLLSAKWASGGGKLELCTPSSLHRFTRQKNGRYQGGDNV